MKVWHLSTMLTHSHEVKWSSIYWPAPPAWTTQGILFFKRFYLFLFREMRRETEREGEKHQCKKQNVNQLPPVYPDRGLNLKPRHAPWPESNWWPWLLWDDAQPTESHRSGQPKTFKLRYIGISAQDWATSTMEYYLAIKKKKIYPLLDGPGEHYAMWSEPVRERQIPCDFTHMWNLMNKLN